eukprot:Rmarinus@m.8437
MVGFESRGYVLEKILGTGAFGSACLVRNSRNEPFAIKTIIGNQTEMELARSEVDVLSRIPRHDHILKYVEHWEEDGAMYLVTEACLQSTLKEMLSSRDWKNMKEETIVELMIHMADALCHLHTNNIIHRDLKPENVFYSVRSLLLGDFGLATSERQTRMHQTQAGTLLYMSPQSYGCEEYTRKTDVWSLGCIFYEMLMGRTPYYKIGTQSFDVVRRDMKKHRYLPIDEKFSPALIELIDDMLSYDESDRPEMSSVLQDLRRVLNPDLEGADLHEKKLITSLLQTCLSAEAEERNLGMKKLKLMCRKGEDTIMTMCKVGMFNKFVLLLISAMDDSDDTVISDVLECALLCLTQSSGSILGRVRNSLRSSHLVTTAEEIPAVFSNTKLQSTLAEIRNFTAQDSKKGGNPVIDEDDESSSEADSDHANEVPSELPVGKPEDEIATNTSDDNVHDHQGVNAGLGAGPNINQGPTNAEATNARDGLGVNPGEVDISGANFSQDPASAEDDLGANLDGASVHDDPSNQSVTSRVSENSATRSDASHTADEVLVEVAPRITEQGLKDDFEKAQIAFHRRHFEEALTTHKQVLNARKSLLRPDHPDVLASLYAIGSCEFEVGNYDEAIEVFDEFFVHEDSLAKSFMPEDTLWDFFCDGHILVGRNCVSRGKYALAKSHLVKARDALEQRHSIVAWPEDRKSCHALLALAQLRMGDVVEAQETLDLVYHSLPVNFYYVKDELIDKILAHEKYFFEAGVDLFYQGRYDEASEKFLVANSTRRKASVGGSEIDQFYAYSLLRSNGCQRREKREQGLQLLLKCFEVRLEEFGESSNHPLETLFLLGSIEGCGVASEDDTSSRSSTMPMVTMRDVKKLPLDPTGAMAMMRLCYDRRLSVLGADHIDTKAAAVELERLVSQEGVLDYISEIASDNGVFAAIQKVEAAYGPRHPRTTQALLHYVEGFCDDAHAENVVATADRLLATYLEISGHVDCNATYAAFLLAKATVFRDPRDDSTALARLQKFEEMRSAVKGDDCRAFADESREAAFLRILVLIGREDKPSDLTTQIAAVVKSYEDAGDDSSEFYAQALYILGTRLIASDLDDASKALASDVFPKCYVLRRRLFGESHCATVQAQWLFGCWNVYIGKLNLGLTILSDALDFATKKEESDSRTFITEVLLMTSLGVLPTPSECSNLVDAISLLSRIREFSQKKFPQAPVVMHISCRLIEYHLQRRDGLCAQRLLVSLQDSLSSAMRGCPENEIDLCRRYLRSIDTGNAHEADARNWKDRDTHDAFSIFEGFVAWTKHSRSREVMGAPTDPKVVDQLFPFGGSSGDILYGQQGRDMVDLGVISDDFKTMPYAAAAILPETDPVRLLWELALTRSQLIRKLRLNLDASILADTEDAFSTISSVAKSVSSCIRKLIATPVSNISTSPGALSNSMVTWVHVAAALSVAHGSWLLSDALEGLSVAHLYLQHILDRQSALVLGRALSGAIDLPTARANISHHHQRRARLFPGIALEEAKSLRERAILAWWNKEYDVAHKELSKASGLCRASRAKVVEDESPKLGATLPRNHGISIFQNAKMREKLWFESITLCEVFKAYIQAESAQEKSTWEAAAATLARLSRECLAYVGKSSLTALCALLAGKCFHEAVNLDEAKKILRKYLMMEFELRKEPSESFSAYAPWDILMFLRFPSWDAIRLPTSVNAYKLDEQKAGATPSPFELEKVVLQYAFVWMACEYADVIFEDGQQDWALHHHLPSYEKVFAEAPVFGEVFASLLRRERDSLLSRVDSTLLQPLLTSAAKAISLNDQTTFFTYLDECYDATEMLLPSKHPAKLHTLSQIATTLIEHDLKEIALEFLADVPEFAESGILSGDSLAEDIVENVWFMLNVWPPPAFTSASSASLFPLGSSTPCDKAETGETGETGEVGETGETGEAGEAAGQRTSFARQLAIDGTGEALGKSPNTNVDVVSKEADEGMNSPETAIATNPGEVAPAGIAKTGVTEDFNNGLDLNETVGRASVSGTEKWSADGKTSATSIEGMVDGKITDTTSIDGVVDGKFTEDATSIEGVVDGKITEDATSVEGVVDGKITEDATSVEGVVDGK